MQVSAGVLGAGSSQVGYFFGRETRKSTAQANYNMT